MNDHTIKINSLPGELQPGDALYHISYHECTACGHRYSITLRLESTPCEVDVRCPKCFPPS